MVVRANPINETESEITLSVRTTSAEWEGDRSDLHDLISLGWAALLHVREVASVELYVILNPATGEPDRIYARPLLNPRLAIVPNEMASELFDAMRFEGALAFHMVNDAFRLGASYGTYDDNDCKTEPPWLSRVCRLTGVRQKAGRYNLCCRPLNDWIHFRAWHRDISVAEIGEEAASTLWDNLGSFQPARCSGPAREAFRTGRIANAVPHQALHLATSLVKAVDGAPDDTVEPLVIPVDSHVIAVGKRSLAAVPAPCGADAFAHEQQLVSARRDAEARTFLSDARAVWAEQIDEGRMQALARELLSQEPGVAWVREVGGVYEPDGGQDLIADWHVGPDRSRILQAGQDGSARLLRRILVQVKVRGRGVGRDDVRDLYDTLRQHECDGFLLIAFPRITVPLFDKLSKMHGRVLWIDWWESAEIERRLRERADIAARFTDLVELVR